MAIRRFLALTEAEMDGIYEMSEPVAWMEGHFPPETDNLQGLFPPGSLLVLTDNDPISEQDIGTVCGQLSRAVSDLNCCALLLDFQKPKTEEAAALISRFSQELPLILPPAYADRQDCPVFLPPVPLDVPLAEYLAPWKNREVWLELALDGQILSLTEKGATVSPLLHAAPMFPCHRDRRLHCHYHIQQSETEVRFTLWRAPEDVDALVAEADEIGVAGCVGLWQEFGQSIVGEGH